MPCGIRLVSRWPAASNPEQTASRNQFKSNIHFHHEPVLDGKIYISKQRTMMCSLPGDGRQNPGAKSISILSRIKSRDFSATVLPKIVRLLTLPVTAATPAANESQS
jgi:hypothetical protein